MYVGVTLPDYRQFELSYNAYRLLVQPTRI